MVPGPEPYSSSAEPVDGRPVEGQPVGGRVGGLGEHPADEARLERLIAERTGELLAANRALESSNETLEAKSEEQESFVYTVSHDLRAPLLAIQGMSTLARDALENDDRDELEFTLGRIEANVLKMSRLLDDLLALSRVGRIADPVTDVDLGEVVAGSLQDLGERLRASGATVEQPATWPSAHVSRSEAEQVVTNLLTNALKYGARPGERPRVRLGWALEDGLVVLRVSDAGPGVPNDRRQAIFELFRKLDPSSEGTGAGLAIVRRVAERHGGRAWAEDSPLGGITLAVAFPPAAA